MTFKEIFPILQQGIAIKHPSYGRLYKTTDKESFYIHVSPTTYRKVVCIDLNLYVLLPINSDQHQLLTDLDWLECSEGWEILWN